MRIALPDALVGADVSLRPLRSEDAAQYAAAFQQDPDLGRLLGIEEDPDEHAVLETVGGQAQLADEGKGVELAIADPLTRQFWGSLLVAPAQLASPQVRDWLVVDPGSAWPRTWSKRDVARPVLDLRRPGPGAG